MEPQQTTETPDPATPDHADATPIPDTTALTMKALDLAHAALMGGGSASSGTDAVPINHAAIAFETVLASGLARFEAGIFQGADHGKVRDRMTSSINIALLAAELAAELAAARATERASAQAGPAISIEAEQPPPPHPLSPEIVDRGVPLVPVAHRVEDLAPGAPRAEGPSTAGTGTA